MVGVASRVVEDVDRRGGAASDRGCNCRVWREGIGGEMVEPPLQASRVAGNWKAPDDGKHCTFWRNPMWN